MKKLLLLMCAVAVLATSCSKQQIAFWVQYDHDQHAADVVVPAVEVKPATYSVDITDCLHVIFHVSNGKPNYGYRLSFGAQPPGESLTDASGNLDVPYSRGEMGYTTADINDPIVDSFNYLVSVPLNNCDAVAVPTAPAPVP